MGGQVHRIELSCRLHHLWLHGLRTELQATFFAELRFCTHVNRFLQVQKGSLHFRVTVFILLNFWRQKPASF